MTDVSNLVKANRLISIPALVRNFMDTHVDLLLVTKDPQNIYPLLFKTYNEELKVLKSKVSPSNAMVFNHSQDQMNQLMHQIENTKRDVKELEILTGSNKIKSTKEKYQKVDLLWFYETIYNELCSHTHNALSALEFRHIEQMPEGNVVIKYMQHYDIKDYYRYLLTMVTYFFDAFVILSESLNLTQETLISNLQNKVSGFGQGVYI